MGEHKCVYGETVEGEVRCVYCDKEMLMGSGELYVEDEGVDSPEPDVVVIPRREYEHLLLVKGWAMAAAESDSRDMLNAAGRLGLC